MEKIPVTLMVPMIRALVEKWVLKLVFYKTQQDHLDNWYTSR